MEGIMSGKLFTTRQGTILLGVIAAVIAAVAVAVYLNQYRNSVNGKNAAVSVLVAKTKILKGTPGNVVGGLGTAPALFTKSSFAQADVQTGAFVDPSSLTGTVVVKDIPQGSQLTADDFGPATNSLTQQLSPNDRAVVVPLGTPQSVGGQIGAGSHVDVWVSLTSSATGPVVQELLQDVTVLGSNGGNVTLRANPQQAGMLIYATENDQIWLVLRPTIGATQKKPIRLKGLTGG